MTEFEKIQMHGIKEDFLKETGEFISKKRKYRNLTQKELGEYLEVGATTISRYENGEIEIPGSNLAVISSVCGFPMRDYVKAWDALELKDIFKNSLELIKYGKQRVRKDYTVQMPPVTQVQESGGEYFKRENLDEEILDIMVSVCTEDEKEDIIQVGLALESLEDEDLQQKLTTVVIEHHIMSRQESEVKKRLMAYYEAFTNLKLDKN